MTLNNEFCDPIAEESVIDSVSLSELSKDEEAEARKALNIELRQDDTLESKLSLHESLAGADSSPKFYKRDHKKRSPAISRSISVNSGMSNDGRKIVHE